MIEKYNNRLNEVTEKNAHNHGVGAGGALPLIMPYRERPRPVKGVPFSDFRVGNSRVEVIKRVVKSSIEVFKRSFN